MRARDLLCNCRCATCGHHHMRSKRKSRPPQAEQSSFGLVYGEPMKGNGLSLVSLFAGCGGSSIGYKAAGYDIRLAVEWDGEAAGIYRTNFPKTTMFEGDVCTLDSAEALRLAGVKPGELDVLDGSPPCQGFSIAGKRKVGDGRNRLFEEYVRLLRAFRPRAFVMENVSGLRKGKMKLVFAETFIALKAAGYRVSCRELNAWWYGVPQDRRRLIFVGLRDDVPGTPGHPAPTFKKPITVAQALGASLVRHAHGWFPGDERSDRPAGTLMTACPPRVKTERSFNHYYSEGTAPTLNAIRPPRVVVEVRGFKDQNPDVWRDGPSSTLTSIRPPRIGIEAHPGYKAAEFKDRTDLPAPTLNAGRRTRLKVDAPAQAAAEQPLEPAEPRYITVTEAKILQGFPDWFKIEVYWPIGNSVPPPLAEAVGRHVSGLLAAAR